MTVELGRRLLRSGVVTAAELEPCLLDVVQRGISLLQALNERWPEVARRVERELERSAPRSVHTVRALPELAARLPTGLCERFLAVPVAIDPQDGVVDVACLDALDAHVAREFAFHLQADVRMLYAPLSQISEAIEGLHAGGSFLGTVNRMLGGSAPAPGLELRNTAWDRSLAAAARPDSEPPPSRGSDRPIPLVRKSLAPRPPSPVAATQELARLTVPEPPAPVLPAPVAPVAPEATAAAKAPRAGFTREDFEALLDALGKAGSAEEVTSHLLEALGKLAEQVLLFSVKAKTFEGRLASGLGLGPESVRELVFPLDAATILQSAHRSGHYLGMLPATPVHARLAALLPAGQEVYAVRISVSGRPALIAVISGFDQAFATSRTSDELVTGASQALERILRTKKTRH